MAGLSSALRDAASGAARSALHGYTDEDESRRCEAALAAGAAVEYLVRSVIAAQDPVLLADRKTPASMVALSRANVSSPLDVRKLKTVGVTEAVGLLGMIHPGLNVGVDTGLIMDVCNAAAHLALVDDALLAEAVAKLAQIAAGLLGVMGADEAAFWGADLVEVAASMKDEYATAVDRRVRAKLARAHAELERLLEALPPTERERTLVILESRSLPWLAADPHVDEPHTCPACGRQGRATYWRAEGSDYQEELVYDRHGYVDDVFYSVDVSFHFAMFQCPVCNLYLEQGEQVATWIPDQLDEEREATDDPHAGWGGDD